MVRLFLVPALTLFALFVRAVRGLVSILHAEGARRANGRAEVATHCCRVKLLLARHTTWPRCLRSPIGLDDGKVNAQEEFGSMESTS